MGTGSQPVLKRTGDGSQSYKFAGEIRSHSTLTKAGARSQCGKTVEAIGSHSTLKRSGARSQSCKSACATGSLSSPKKRRTTDFAAHWKVIYGSSLFRLQFTDVQDLILPPPTCLFFNPQGDFCSIPVGVLHWTTTLQCMTGTSLNQGVKIAGQPWKFGSCQLVDCKKVDQSSVFTTPLSPVQTKPKAVQELLFKRPVSNKGTVTLSVKKAPLIHWCSPLQRSLMISPLSQPPPWPEHCIMGESNMLPHNQKHEVSWANWGSGRSSSRALERWISVDQGALVTNAITLAQIGKVSSIMKDESTTSESRKASAGIVILFYDQ